jgi:hypothetical protein
LARGAVSADAVVDPPFPGSGRRRSGGNPAVPVAHRKLWQRRTDRSRVHRAPREIPFSQPSSERDRISCPKNQAGRHAAAGDHADRAVRSRRVRATDLASAADRVRSRAGRVASRDADRGRSVDPAAAARRTGRQDPDPPGDRRAIRIRLAFPIPMAVRMAVNNNNNNSGGGAAAPGAVRERRIASSACSRSSKHCIRPPASIRTNAGTSRAPTAASRRACSI